MGEKMKTLRLTRQLIKCARIKKRRKQVAVILLRIWSNAKIGYITSEQMRMCPSPTANRQEWMKWTREAETYMKKQQKQLSARNRVKQRKAVNKNLARRERQATLNTQLKKFLNYALRRGHKEPRQLALHVRTGETTTIIDTKTTFHATEMEHTATHMGVMAHGGDMGWR